jgi:hypothetical protein
MKTWLVVAASVAMVATTVSAEDYQSDDIREMRETVLQLKDQVQAQQQQLDSQREVMLDAGLEDERGSGSRLSSFLETTDFSGWVAASYFFDTNDPSKDNPNSASPYSNPYHNDPNGFQFDEGWFVMDRPATEESPAGFHFEAVFGATASGAANGNPGGNDVWIPSANVSYMTPFGPTITAGKFGTPIGYEVAGAPNNVNITRGFMWNLFQPVSQIGAKVSQDLDGGLTYTLGVVNGLTEDQPDPNRSKGYIWQLGWGNDQATVLFNGLYENDANGGANHDRYILDAVVELTPADNLLFWANFDYTKTKMTGAGNPEGAGISLGGRVGITEKMGIGGRFEYAKFFANNQAALKGDLYSATVTTDYALTDNLTWKVEGKYETGTDGAGQAYANGSTNVSDDAFYLGTQLYYEF